MPTKKAANDSTSEDESEVGKQLAKKKAPLKTRGLESEDSSDDSDDEEEVLKNRKKSPSKKATERKKANEKRILDESDDEMSPKKKARKNPPDEEVQVVKVVNGWDDMIEKELAEKHEQFAKIALKEREARVLRYRANDSKVCADHEQRIAARKERLLALKEKREARQAKKMTPAQLEEFEKEEDKETRGWEKFFKAQMATGGNLRNKYRSELAGNVERRVARAMATYKNFVSKNHGGFPKTHVEAGEDGKQVPLLHAIRYEPADKDGPESFLMLSGKKLTDPKTGRTYYEKEKPCGNPEWLAYMYGEGFINYCLKHGKRVYDLTKKCTTFPLSAGDSNDEVAPAACLVKEQTGVGKIRFRQGESRYCLPYSLASAFSHLGWSDAANQMKLKGAQKILDLPKDKQLGFVSNFVVRSCASSRLKPVANESNAEFAGETDVEKVVEKLRSYDLVVIIPEGNDDYSSHAVTYCQGLIFDATQEWPLRPCKETFDFICGQKGFRLVKMVRIFKFAEEPNKKKKKKNRKSNK